MDPPSSKFFVVARLVEKGKGEKRVTFVVPKNYKNIVFKHVMPDSVPHTTIKNFWEPERLTRLESSDNQNHSLFVCKE